MRRLILIFLLIFCLKAEAQPAPIIVEFTEEDGSPSTYPYQVKVTNGTLTDNADGTASIASGGTTFYAEDGDGTEVNITNNKEWKFVEGVGIDIDWTDTSDGTDADPYDLTVTCNLEGTELASTGEGGATKFLREDGDGTCSWQAVAGGSGDSVTVNGSAADTTANFLDNTDITWTLADGGAGGPDNITGTVVDDSHNHIITNIDAFTKANLETQCSDVANFAEADGDDYTGTHDFNAAVLEVPNAAAPTVDATGRIGVDTDLITQGMLQVYLTSAIANVPACTDTPGDNEIPKYDLASGTFSFEADATGGAGAAELLLQPMGAVLDDSSPPSLTVWESIGTATPRRIVADFDPDTDEILSWSFTWQGYSNADVYWCSNDTGANEDAIWAIQISATTPADADSMAEDAADTANTESGNVDTNEAYRLLKTTVALSNTDSAATDDWVTLVLFRDANDSIGDADDDSLTSDARLVGIYLY